MAAGNVALPEKVAIVGAGIMGAGIAETFAAAGITALLFDQQAGKASEAKAAIAHRHEARIAAGKTDALAIAKLLEHICPADQFNMVATCGLVIEAIVEKIEAKKSLVVELERILPPIAVIATNTSSLSVTAIAAGASHPERIAGFHFFNPVPLMKVVEVIRGAFTGQAAVDTLSAVAQRIGHRPVMAKDTPGFIVNHAGRAFSTEALQMLREGIAPIAAIDAILRDAANFRMGPFELMDLTGLDVSHPVMEEIYAQYYHDSRYRPSGIARQRLEAGLLGRKTGRGFYDYSDGAKQAEQSKEDHPYRGPPPEAICILGDFDDGEMLRIVSKAGIPVSDNLQDANRPETFVFVGLVGEDLTGAIVRQGLNPDRCIGFDPLFGLTTHRTLVASPATSEEAKALALSVARHDGMKATLVADSCGAVCQRVVAMIVNIATEIVEQQIATVEDVDAAVKLGLGYPFGPLEWGDRIGPGRVLAILDRIYDRTRDPRYRASLWLRRHAELGVSLKCASGEQVRAVG